MNLLHQDALDVADADPDVGCLHTAIAPTGNIAYLHDKVRAVSNHRRDKAAGQDRRGLNSGDQSKHSAFDLWTTIAQDNFWKGEIRIRAKDGAFYGVDSTIIPFLTVDGSPQYVLIHVEMSERGPIEADAANTRSGPRHDALTVMSYNASTFHDRDRVLQSLFTVAREVTERKCFADTLHQKNLELQAASRMKSDFLVNLSRELRARLNSIVGFSEILKDGLAGEMTAQQRQRASHIFDSGKYMLLLTKDILDLSKVEAGKMTLDLEAVDVASLCESGLSIFSEQAASRDIRLEIDAAVELGAINADLCKCKQILYNLLSNAVKFSDTGGQVTLRVRRVCRADVGRPSGSRASRRFPLAESEFAEFLEISVTDSGIGMSADSLGLLFEPFTQIDGGLTQSSEGAGLGLATVKLLAELHGGSVAVESAVSEGSSFAVWLPL